MNDMLVGEAESGHAGFFNVREKGLQESKGGVFDGLEMSEVGLVVRTGETNRRCVAARMMEQR